MNLNNDIKYGFNTTLKENNLLNIKFSVVKRTNMAIKNAQSEKDTIYFKANTYLFYVLFFLIALTRTFARDLSHSSKTSLSTAQFPAHITFKIESFEKLVIELPLALFISMFFSLIDYIFFRKFKQRVKVNLLTIQIGLLIAITGYYVLFSMDLQKNAYSSQYKTTALYRWMDFDNPTKYRFFKYPWDKIKENLIKPFANLCGIGDQYNDVILRTHNSVLSCITDSLYPLSMSLFWNWFNDQKKRFQLNDETCTKNTINILSGSSWAQLIILVYLVVVLLGLASSLSIGQLNLKFLIGSNFLICILLGIGHTMIEGTMYNKLFDKLVINNLIYPAHKKYTLKEKKILVDEYYSMNTAIETSDQIIQKQKVKNVVVETFTVRILIFIFLANVSYFLFTNFIKSGPSTLLKIWVNDNIKDSSKPVPWIFKRISDASTDAKTKGDSVQYVVECMTNLGTFISIDIIKRILSSSLKNKSQSTTGKVILGSFIALTLIGMVEIGALIGVSYNIIPNYLFIAVLMCFIDGFNRGIKYQALDFVLILGFNSPDISDGNKKNSRKFVDAWSNRVSKSVLVFASVMLAQYVNFDGILRRNINYSAMNKEQIDKKNASLYAQAGVGKLLVHLANSVILGVSLYQIYKNIKKYNLDNSNSNKKDSLKKK